MNICPITYKETEYIYSHEGLKLLSPKLTTLNALDYTAEEQRIEAIRCVNKISIQGVQPKYSAKLNIKESRFDIVDNGGLYILKPQHHIFKGMPENEGLTMTLADAIGINVPVHGLVMSKDGSFTYFIKRFDRRAKKEKVAVEDFSQLAELSRDLKYDYSFEKLIKIVEEECTFPMIEKSKLFKLMLFNFLVGNEDMHLKNYSLISLNNKIEFSPAYDLINSTIIIGSDAEESALLIKGKKSNFNRAILIDYIAYERMHLTMKVVEKTLDIISSKLDLWKKMISVSFMSEHMKESYLSLLDERITRLQL